MKYLYEKDNIVYAKCTECGRVLKFQKHDVDEIKTGVECFCGNVSNCIEGIPNKKASENINDNTGSSTAQNQTPRQHQPSGYYNNVPKCPMCNSTSVAKITVTSRAVGAFTLGILSSNLGKTMKCNSCGYKW